VVPWLLVGPLVLAGVGGGCVITPNQALSLARIDARGGSTAGGMLQTAQRVGAAAGAAVLSAIFYAVLARPAQPGTDRGYSLAFAASAAGTCCIGALALVVAIVDARAEAKERAGGERVSALSH